ncbi:MAG: hypothetical protein HYV01_19310 [Deltaproteobacteria bacterium]|nr:hypothetical protein [Deltaproteobacteria bacterium]
MGTKVFTKTVEINGAFIALRSLDGTSWSSDLKGLRRFQAERNASLAVTRKAFKTIGVSDRWGMSQWKKRKAG